MHVIRSVEALRSWRETQAEVVLVPTMGNLHAGHLALIEQARAATKGSVLVSIFVNPLQFEDPADLARYPRTEEQDLDQMRAAGVDAVFLPGVEELYPAGQADLLHVEVGALATVWEGRSRPGHFSGVATVVAKLFNLVQPAKAIFGQKDYQQLLVIRKLVADLNFPVDILAAPIVRAPDGLALSSRNRFLSEQERRVAAQLNRALVVARDALQSEEAVDIVLDRARTELARHGFAIDYLAFCDNRTLQVLTSPGEGMLIAAVRLGNVRLLDNCPVG